MKISCAVSTFDEEEYVIEKGKELFEYLHQNVEVTGDRAEDEDGNFIMNVIGYRLRRMRSGFYENVHNVYNHF